MKKYLETLNFICDGRLNFIEENDKTITFCVTLPYNADLNIGFQVFENHLEYRNSDGVVNEYHPSSIGMIFEYEKSIVQRIKITCKKDNPSDECKRILKGLNAFLGYYEQECKMVAYAMEDVKRYEEFERVTVLPYNSASNTPVYSLRVKVKNSKGQFDGFYKYLLMNMDDCIQGIFHSHKSGTVKLYLPNSQIEAHRKAMDDLFLLLLAWDRDKE